MLTCLHTVKWPVIAGTINANRLEESSVGQRTAEALLWAEMQEN